MSALTDYLAGQPHTVVCATFGQHGAGRLSRCSCWQSGVLAATEADHLAAIAVGVAILEGRGLTVSDVAAPSLAMPPELGGI